MKMTRLLIMLILAVDTSTRSGSIAVLRDGEVLRDQPIRSATHYSATFFEDVDDLLRASGILLKEIDLFAVCAGPGSFTGLRIGLTAVKGWAEVFAKPVAAVSCLEAIAFAGWEHDGDRASVRLVAPLLDAHQGQIFLGLYRSAEKECEMHACIEGDLLAPVDEGFEILQRAAAGEPMTFATPTPDVFREALDRSGLRHAEVRQVSSAIAPAIGKIGYAKALRGEVVDALGLDANYVRRCDAEVKWKGGA